MGCLKKSFPLDELQTLIDQNYTIIQLAKHFGTSKPTMGNFLKENGLETLEVKKRRLLQEKKANNKIAIIQDYKDGMSSLQLEKKYNIENSVIVRLLKENGVTIRTNSEAHKKYTENYHYFDNIDTMDKAYLLGFICADGYVTPSNQLGITVATKDKAIIEWFQKQMETDKPLREVSNNKGIELRIQNKKITDKLKEYGIIPNKSLVLDIGEVIKKAKLNDAQIKAFLLGYFDGDGGIYKSLINNSYFQYSCSVTGTIETCTYYKTYFNDIGFITKRHKDDKNNYTYQIGGRNKVKEGLSKLYEIKDQLSFYYQRKYNIFVEL